jgi:hypothetical protein
MNNKSVEDLMECSSEVHFSGFHMEGLEERKAGTEQPTTSAIDEYKQPFVIGLCFFVCGNVVVVYFLSVCVVLELGGGDDLFCLMLCLELRNLKF